MIVVVVAVAATATALMCLKYVISFMFNNGF
jgi:hypothetical protein